LATLAVSNEVSVFGGNTEQGSSDHDGSGEDHPCGLWRHSEHKQEFAAIRQQQAHEKAIRLPADHPKNLALCGNNQHCLQRSSWREQASCLLDTLPSELRDRQSLEFAPVTCMDQSCR